MSTVLVAATPASIASAAGDSTTPPWAMVNSPERARAVAPSGITMTVTKKMATGTRISQADVLPANAKAPADEYLIPVNAKAAAGISDLYEGFRVRPNGWTDVASLTFTFSKPVRNPRLHVAGTGGASADKAGNREDYWPGLRLAQSNAGSPTFTKVAGFPGFEVSPQVIAPTAVGPEQETTCGVVYMCGTAQVNGMISSFTLDLLARNVRRGLPAGDPFVWGVFRITFEEDASDAPASYGAATHSISALSIGPDVTADLPDTISFTPRRVATDVDDAATGVLPDGTLRAQQGERIRLSVPMRSASAAVLAGWIDFNRDGVFQPSERASVSAPAGSSRPVLTWTAPREVKHGPTWVRLRTAASPETLTSPSGWAATGEVEDYRVTLRR
ncbi:GEVED domain-containing protein [Nonomuraea sp. NPDC050663]|uniref:GEVED domain-containing protein n=1 Tax=Nonomuraea sp. NPDC050663 TaxID=3364370 RepID=UPI0037A251FF